MPIFDQGGHLIGADEKPATKMVLSYNRQTRRTGPLEIPVDTKCSVPTCSSGAQYGPGLASYAITGIVPTGIAIIGNAQATATLYMCDACFDTTGEEESDIIADLTRSGKLR